MQTFECFLKPVDNNTGEKTTQFQTQEPSGFCFIVKSFDDNKYEKAVRYTKHYEDEDVSKTRVGKSC